jgi:hypothetical protein
MIHTTSTKSQDSYYKIHITITKFARFTTQSQNPQIHEISYYHGGGTRTHPQEGRCDNPAQDNPVLSPKPMHLALKQ